MRSLPLRTASRGVEPSTPVVRRAILSSPRSGTSAFIIKTNQMSYLHEHVLPVGNQNEWLCERRE